LNPKSASAKVSLNPSDEVVVRLERVRVQFGALRAVADVSFSLHPGNLLGLIGPNGAGKTTLLRAVAGLQSRASGSIQILGQELDPAEPQIVRHIGFTPDTPPLYDGLSVRDFLRFIGKGYRLTSSEVEERIDFWLEKVWLKEKANQKIKSLSRGMRQRVGIARTLLPNPAIVLLDEPAAGLDPAGRVQFRQLLCDLRDQGKVLIVSSHILSDMQEYCTHIGMMHGGRMVKFGTVAHVSGLDDPERCRYKLILANSVPRLAELLGGLPEVSNVKAERDQASFEYRSDRAAAAQLLAMLINENVPVSSFTADAPGIEQAYLRAGIGQVD
jgi:ABC-2 type transport system ATP-binding protein